MESQIPLFIACLLLCAAFSNGTNTGNTRKTKAVMASLDAKWQDTPLVLEISEYLAEEKPEYFWAFVDRITELEPEFLHRGSDRDYYDLLMTEVSHIISQEKMNLLKFALSLRSYSPTVELFQQIAKTKNLPAECMAVIEVNSEFTCDPMDLEALLNSAPDRNRSTTFKLDHHYVESLESYANPVTVVLYGELGTAAFREFHFILKGQSRQRHFDYVVRHYMKDRGGHKVRLSGYGVELAMKSTEYRAQDDTKVESEQSDGADTTRPDSDEIDELEGFVFSRLKTLYPQDIGALNKFRDHLMQDTQDLVPLKVWQLKDLGMQAAQRIMSSPIEEALWVMRDIAQNFPLQAHSLIKTTVDENLSKEIQKNQNMFTQHLTLSPSDTALFINGIFFDPDVSDIYTILDVLREELRLIEELHRLGVKSQQMEKILSLDLSVSREDYAVDIRDSAIRYLNDLENDRAYAAWLSSINDILRPTYPGLLRSIRKNIFHLVAIVDPNEPECHDLLKLLESFHVHRAPIRIGLSFAVNPDPLADGFTDAGIAMLNAFNFVADEKGSLYNGLSFLTDIYAKMGEGTKVTSKDVIDAFRAEYPGEDLELIFGLDSDYDTGRKLAWDFLQRTGLKGPPEVLINGVRLPKDKLNGDDFEEAVLAEIMEQTVVVQKAVYKGELSDSDDILDFLMQRDNVVQRLNDRVLNSSWQLIDVTGTPVLNVSPDAFAKLSSSDKTSTIVADLQYLTDRDDFSFRPVTIWVVTDLATQNGRQLLLDAIEQMRTSNDIRIAIIHNPVEPENANLQALVDGIEFVLQLNKKRSRVLIEKFLKVDNAELILSGNKKIVDFLEEGNETTLYRDWIKKEKQNILKIHSVYSTQVIQFIPGQLGIVTNGRILGPFGKDETFTVDDYNLLERHSLKTFGDKVRKVFEDHEDEGERDSISDLAFRISALILGRTNVRTRHHIKYRSAEYSVVKIPPRHPDNPAFNLTVIVDPVSRGAQKVAHILSVLQEVLNCRIWIFLNSQSKLSEMPLKTFYRYVLDSEIQFTADDRFSSGPMARFQKVPAKPLFTMNMDTPENWMVEVVRTPFDLDNIHLEEVDGLVYGEYELEYLLIEGHCFDQASGTPPRGLQFILGTVANPEMEDTIVMANLGYFQLKASPGAWFLRLRKGRSSEIYDIDSHEGTNSDPGSPDVQIFVGNFRSKIVKIKVAKKPDKRNLDLLSEADSEKSGGIWNSITSTFSGSSTPKETDDEASENVINIFSLASGHLYERLLRIMMLSILKNTQTPVKFWFLKNYLSPSFKDFLPFMAKQYGFEYHLVQYKWPRWLHQQTEKQRIIWGYKILFLDVLFPLNVKKIIFVDADQVVRADMKDLRDIDLGGAPYGYTPFCESRKDMDGYRFWKSGYWSTHLQGRKYHISALYVVDLKKFRRIAAGDRLRGQYQGLSQDPNSLSNLDQDLPNNMIHQVAIKSLPQEWLWCETWCEESTKKQAKTIDLCNNPMTKESKLSSAMRIIPEWKDYDEEIRHLMEAYLGSRSNGSKNGEQTAKDSSRTKGDKKHEHGEL